MLPEQPAGFGEPAGECSPLARAVPGLAKVPIDPWGNPYIYRYPSNHDTEPYDLLSAGPDGKEGTSDDIVSWK
jgi:hypothetical protein